MTEHNGKDKRLRSLEQDNARRDEQVKSLRADHKEHAGFIDELFSRLRKTEARLNAVEKTQTLIIRLLLANIAGLVSIFVAIIGLAFYLK